MFRDTEKKREPHFWHNDISAELVKQIRNPEFSFSPSLFLSLTSLTFISPKSNSDWPWTRKLKLRFYRTTKGKAQRLKWKAHLFRIPEVQYRSIKSPLSLGWKKKISQTLTFSHLLVISFFFSFLISLLLPESNIFLFFFHNEVFGDWYLLK